MHSRVSVSEQHAWVLVVMSGHAHAQADMRVLSNSHIVTQMQTLSTVSFDASAESYT